MVRLATLACALVLGVGLGYLFWGTSTPASLESELAKLPKPAAPRGGGRISGTIRSTGGEPLAGVVVQAVPLDAWAEAMGWGVQGPLRLRALEEEVRDFVASYWLLKLGTVDATTDGKGAYSLEGLMPETGYAVRPHFQKAAWEIESTSRSPWDVEPDATIDFEVKPVVEVAVDVVLPDGSQPTSAALTTSSETTTGHRTWTRTTRTVRLEPGAWRLSATVQTDEEEFASGEVGVEVRHGEPAEPVVLRLRGRPGLRGTVTLAGGDRADSLTVETVRLAAGRQPSPELLAESGDGHSAFVDKGRYRIHGLRPGRHLVGVVLGRVVLATRVVEVGDGTATCDLEVGPLDPARYVLLRVLGPDGEPVKEVAIDTGYRSDDGNGQAGGGTFLRGSDGSLKVLHHSHLYEEPGTYSIRVRAKGLGAREIRYRRGETSELEIRFKAPARVTARIRDVGGEPERYALSLSRDPPDPDAQMTAWDDPKQPDVSGRFLLGAYEPGAYVVTLFVGGLPAESRRVELASGEKALEFDKPALHSLTIEARELEPGARFDLRPRGWPGTQYSVQKSSDADRKVTFTDLPAGAYTIRSWWSGDDRSMTVEVPAKGPVVWKPGR